MNKFKFHMLTRKAKAGDPEAQFRLYEIYYDGDEDLDIGWDPENAVKWVQKSADQGYVPAIGELGRLWINGGIIDMVDPAKGVKMEFEAADKGYLPSMFRVGKYLFTGKTDVSDSPGEYVEIDVDRALEYWEKAAGEGNLDAGLAYAKAAIMGVGLDQEFNGAHEIIDTIIDAVDPEDSSQQGLLAEAQFWKGYFYYYGLGVEANRQDADHWFIKSAEGGFLPADDVVTNNDDPREALMNWDYPYDYDTWCSLYCPDEEEGAAAEEEEEEEAEEEALTGSPFCEDEDKYAVFSKDDEILGRAAMNGNMAALARVGQLLVEDWTYYWELLEVDWDKSEENDRLLQDAYALYMEDRFVEAIDLYLTPAYHGYTDAMFCLGECYFKYWQDGGEAPAEGDPEWDDDFCWGNAFRWYLMGAANMSKRCQYRLGEAYYYGRVPNSNGEFDIPEDYPSAQYWFEQAARDNQYEKGDADAANFLGTMYADGLIGGNPDHAKAVEWYKRATELSDTTLAWYNLGLSYEKGNGVPRDEVKAMECYDKIADFHPDANARYAILLYNRNLNSPVMKEAAIRRLKQAARFSTTAQNALNQLGIQ